MDATAVRRGLRLQALGNELIALFGGRSVHPVGTRVGGFYRRLIDSVDNLLVKSEPGLTGCGSTADTGRVLELPDDQQEFCSVSLKHDH